MNGWTGRHDLLRMNSLKMESAYVNSFTDMMCPYNSMSYVYHRQYQKHCTMAHIMAQDNKCINITNTFNQN